MTIFCGFLSLLLLPVCESINAKQYSLLPKILKTENQSDKHGGIKMGVISDACDNGHTFIEVDLKYSTTGYSCNKPIDNSNEKPVFKIKVSKNEDPPIHTCLPEDIIYKDDIPTSGSHRPLWPKYGAYKYVPPQRWVHSLEHGAAVFLYHPCADKDAVEKFKSIAFSCLKKIIVTPYSKVSKEMPFVIVTYMNKLLMNTVQEYTIKNYLKNNNWCLASECNVWKDGFYNLFLERSSYSNTILQENYTSVCPQPVKNSMTSFNNS